MPQGLLEENYNFAEGSREGECGFRTIVKTPAIDKVNNDGEFYQTFGTKNGSWAW